MAIFHMIQRMEQNCCIILVSLEGKERESLSLRILKPKFACMFATMCYFAISFND